MPTFKPKNTKKMVTDKNSQSLDCKHEEFLQKFKKTDKYTLPENSRVLDVGCGQGVALELFKKERFSAVGITINSEDVSVCRQKGYEVYEMDQSFLEFNNEEFDFIWCRHCLQHSIFPYFTLTELFRVLKRKGYLYIEVPAPDTIDASPVTVQS